MYNFENNRNFSFFVSFISLNCNRLILRPEIVIQTYLVLLMTLKIFRKSWLTNFFYWRLNLVFWRNLLLLHQITRLNESYKKYSVQPICMKLGIWWLENRMGNILMEWNSFFDSHWLLLFGSTFILIYAFCLYRIALQSRRRNTNLFVENVQFRIFFSPLENV